LNIVGRKVYLRAIEFSDLSFINKLRNDDSIFQKTTGNKYYISSEYDRKWIEDKIFNNYKQLYLVVCRIDTNEPIGYICAINIDHINRKAEFGGLVISSEYHSNGFGTEACLLLLDHLFEELGMNMIFTVAKEDNSVTLRLFEKLHVQCAGVLRDYVYKQGHFYNAYIYSLLHSEYKEFKTKLQSEKLPAK
jgi:[ribosomal protein S5]-alanine N-acetyltransferase